MTTAINILLIEDNEDDVFLIIKELSRYWTKINHLRVEKLSELEAALKQKWDIILSDFMLPEFDGLTALRLIRHNKIATPFILVSGRVEEDVAASMMRLGANDYIMKDNLKRLEPAIRRELNEQSVRKDLKAAEEKVQELSKIVEPLSQKATEQGSTKHPDIGSHLTEGIQADNIKERHKAVVNILYAANLIRKHQAKILERHNLSEPQFNVLRVLKRHFPKEVSINLVKEEIANKTSDVSRIIDRMVKSGLIHYFQNPHDKRVRNISITQKGVEVLTEMDKSANEMFLPDSYLPEEDARTVNQKLQKLLNLMDE
ncbi:MAG: response receiver sensor histidine kinase response regulator [Bacteroidota bacterium]|nr:response receiver sensor histidine kinase response regulator [Bacteroidota bacterium]